MSNVTPNCLVEVHVPDFEITKEFYNKLNFENAWERPPEGFKGYLVMKLENNVICFWAGNKHVYEQDYFKQFPKETPRGYGIELVLMVKDIEKYYQEIQSKIEIFEPLVMRPWGLKDFRIADPFGYYLRFTSVHDILDPKYAVK